MGNYLENFAYVKMTERNGTMTWCSDMSETNMIEDILENEYDDK